MKIIVFGLRNFPGYQGGIEKHCEELYRRLSSLGCEITVITRSLYSQKGAPDTWQGINFIRVWAPRSSYLEAICHSIISAFIVLSKRPDIVHIHGVGPSLVLPMLKLFSLKIVVTDHGPDYQRKKWGLLAKLFLKLGEFFSVRFSDALIVISLFIKDFISKKYSSSNPLYIPNGVNIPEKPYYEGGISAYGLKPKKYIFTACRFVPEKGLHDLIEAYLRLGSPAYRLVIAGDSDTKTDYSSKIKLLAKKSNNIILTGRVSGSLLEGLFSNSLLFVIPSYYEGLPIALLEAMSFGVPVLASDIPQLREIPLEEFRYFKPGDVDGLSKNIELLTRTGMTQEENTKYLSLLKENYNWDKVAEDVLKIYNQVKAL